MRSHKSGEGSSRRGQTLRLAVFVGALGLVAVACAGTAEPVRDSGVTVVATNTIWADVVTVIVGDEGSVISLMPVGSDPHDFRPSAAQVSDMVGADLVVANGLGLEQGLDPVLEGASGDGVNVLELGPLVMPVSRVDRAECDDAVSHDHEDAAGCDPHVWMDPDRVVLAVAAIADALTTIDPTGGWQERAAAYIADVEALATEMEGILDAVDPGRRLLVTNHDSLGYFADRFDFDVVATVIPGGSTLANPSSADLADLVATMRELGIDVIFADTSDSTALADAVAAELGGSVTVVELYSGSLGVSGSGAATLIDMLRTDALLIATALS